MKNSMVSLIFIAMLNCTLFSITLHQAAREGDCKALKQFLANGTMIDQKSPITEQTLLHIAAKHGQDNAVKFLLQQEANRYLQDCNGQTALHAAVIGCAQKILGIKNSHKILNHYFKIIDLLLNFPVDHQTIFEMKDKNHKTILHYAIYTHNIQLFERLIIYCEQHKIIIVNIDKAYLNQVKINRKIGDLLGRYHRITGHIY